MSVEHGPSDSPRSPCSDCETFLLPEQLFPCATFGSDYHLCAWCLQRAGEQQDDQEQ